MHIEVKVSVQVCEFQWLIGSNTEGSIYKSWKIWCYLFNFVRMLNFSDIHLFPLPLNIELPSSHFACDWIDCACHNWVTCGCNYSNWNWRMNMCTVTRIPGRRMNFTCSRYMKKICFIFLLIFMFNQQKQWKIYSVVRFTHYISFRTVCTNRIISKFKK